MESNDQIIINSSAGHVPFARSGPVSVPDLVSPIPSVPVSKSPFSAYSRMISCWKLSYARSELNKFLKVEPLKDIIALLAYDGHLKSCVGYLLKQSQREFVADAANAIVLSTNPNLKNTESCMYSCLEKLLRHLTACILERRALNENQGEVFDLRR